MRETKRAVCRERLELPAPPGLRSTLLEAGAEQYLVLSHPLIRWQLPPELTSAQREIVSAILDGKTRDQVARERGSSVRTVANLMAQAFRKLGVRSRIELAAQLSGLNVGHRE